MTLKQICTTLETSRRLKEAGFPQEGGIAYWGKHKRHKQLSPKRWGVELSEYLIELEQYVGDFGCEKYRAFTFNELWEILPKDIIEKHKYRLQIGKTWNDCFLLYYWNVYPFEDSIDNNLERFIHKQPQKAAAELALWCVKEGYLNPKEIK